MFVTPLRVCRPVSHLTKRLLNGVGSFPTFQVKAIDISYNTRKAVVLGIIKVHLSTHFDEVPLYHLGFFISTVE